jgi:hypothetical protein
MIEVVSSPLSFIKRVRYPALALAGLIALGFALALVLVDGDRVREAIGARIEAALGEPVELGAAELSLFPLPAARIRDVRIGARLEAQQIRVGVSLPALLLGRVVLRSLEIQRPRLRPSAPRAAAPEESAPRWNAERADDVDVAITSLTVHEGILEMGEERLERVELGGSIDPTRGASFDFSAEAPEIGRFEDGRFEIAGLGGDPAQWSWQTSARIADLDVERLRERVGFRSLWGHAEGSISAAGTGSQLERGSLALESADFEVRGAALRVWGPTLLQAEYPARTLDVDLSRARVTLPQTEKPPGVALRLHAGQIELDEVVGPRAGELRIESDALRASGELEIREGSPAIELDGGSLDLERFAAAWTAPSWLPHRGRVDLEQLRLDAGTLALGARGSLSGVRVELPSGLDVGLDGPVFVDGATLGADGLRVEVAGEAVSASLRYDRVSKQVQLALLTEGARVGPVLEKVVRFKDVSGRLYARLELSGPLDFYAMKGKGEFDLVDGTWTGLDLPRLALPVGSDLQPSDPQPQERTRRTQRIRGRLEVDGDEVNVIEGFIEQDYAQARLSGVIYLRDLFVDVSGELSVFSPDLPEPVVMPVLRAGGPLNELGFHVGAPGDAEMRKAAAAMVEASRKAERERRRTEREQRKAKAAGG